MIESGMSLSHMKTNVTIVSHGRVSLVTRLVPTASAASGTGTVFWRMPGVCAAVATTNYARYGVRFL